MGSSWKGRRSWMRSAYFYDMRYGQRDWLDSMDWQRGVLSVETDTMLVGDREAMIASVFQRPSTELQPDPKLQQVSAQDFSDQIMAGDM